MNAKCFNRFLGDSYLSIVSRYGDTVKISSSAAELDDIDFCAYNLFRLSVLSFTLILKNSSYFAIRPRIIIFLFYGVEK